MGGERADCVQELCVHRVISAYMISYSAEKRKRLGQKRPLLFSHRSKQAKAVRWVALDVSYKLPSDSVHVCCLQAWGGEPCGRMRASPHIKTYTRFLGQQLAWWVQHIVLSVLFSGLTWPVHMYQPKINGRRVLRDNDLGCCILTL